MSFKKLNLQSILGLLAFTACAPALGTTIITEELAHDPTFLKQRNILHLEYENGLIIDRTEGQLSAKSSKFTNFQMIDNNRSSSVNIKGPITNSGGLQLISGGSSFVNSSSNSAHITGSGSSTLKMDNKSAKVTKEMNNGQFIEAVETLGSITVKKYGNKY